MSENKKPIMLGKYQLLDEIGKGGYGRVYKALDTGIEVLRGVKVLDPKWSGDPNYLKRFVREARTVAKLEHPHILPVYEVNEEQGMYYMAMRYMPGRSLKDLLQVAGRLPLERAVRLVKQIADGLDFAHQKGIVHRDVKPGNILLEENGDARLSDFGFASSFGGVDGGSISDSLDNLLGTPFYIAPEIWDNQKASPESDQYALACVFVEMLTGEVLFHGDSAMQVMRKHDQGVQLPEEWPFNAPQGLNAFLLKALSKDPIDRFEDMQAFKTALRKVADHKKPVEEPEIIEEDPIVNDPNSIEEQQPEENDSEEKIEPEPLVEKVEELAQSDENEESSEEDNYGDKDGDHLKPKPKINFLLIAAVVIVIGAAAFFAFTQLGGKQAQAPASVQSPHTHLLDLKQYSSGIKIGTAESDGIPMVFIPAGEFLMGTANGDDDEKPEHIVYLDAYWIDQTEVTQAMYAKCVEDGICDQPGSLFEKSEYDPFPVVYVDWHEAQNLLPLGGQTSAHRSGMGKSSQGD